MGTESGDAPDGVEVGSIPALAKLGSSPSGSHHIQKGCDGMTEESVWIVAIRDKNDENTFEDE